jgi:hypothetical protein
MSIEHSDIVSSETHEPKGVATAIAGEVYVADGAGSGVWQAQDAVNEVIVNTITDFPTASGGIIDLLADTRYVVASSLSTANRFVLQNNTQITSFSTLSPVFEYTGSGTMFTAVDASTIIQDIRLNCPNGQVFDYSDVATPNSSSCRVTDVFINSCNKVGTFDSLVSFVYTNTTCFTVEDGITLLGTGWLVWRIQNPGFISTNAAFVGIDMGVATCLGIEIGPSLVSMVAGGVYIEGAAASANIPAGRIGRIVDSSMIGTGTLLDGIGPDDSRWVFSGNDGVKDTNPEAFAFMRSNATATVISVINTPVLLAGVFTAGTASQFSVTAAGRITYMGERSACLPLSANISAQTASGGDKDVTFYLAKNGVVDNDTGTRNNIKLGNPSNTTVLWQDGWDTGDYWEIWVENNDGTENILGQDVKFVVN